MGRCPDLSSSVTIVRPFLTWQSKFICTLVFQNAITIGVLIRLWLHEESSKLQDWKNVFILHIPPLNSILFIVLTFLTQPRSIILAVLQTTLLQLMWLLQGLKTFVSWGVFGC
jgi:hypothetical protein